MKYRLTRHPAIAGLTRAGAAAALPLDAVAGAAGSVMLVATGPVNTPGGAVNFLCDQVRVLNAPGDGLYNDDDTRETTFRDCRFEGSGRDGITFTCANHSTVDGIKLQPTSGADQQFRHATRSMTGWGP
jgi:hypothetical protein